MYEKYRWSEKQIRSLAKENYTYNVFINKATSLNIYIVNEIYSFLTDDPNENIIPLPLPIPKIIK